MERRWTRRIATVSSFDYRETLIFTPRDVKLLAYEQRVQKRNDGQTEWLESHWENGFIRFLENGELEMVNAQIGRSEVLIRSIESLDNLIRIHFVRKVIINYARMISSARTFELEVDCQRYTMEMQTTAVEQLVPHLKIGLKRIK